MSTENGKDPDAYEFPLVETLDFTYLVARPDFGPDDDATEKMQIDAQTLIPDDTGKVVLHGKDVELKIDETDVLVESGVCGEHHSGPAGAGLEGYSYYTLSDDLIIYSQYALTLV